MIRIVSIFGLLVTVFGIASPLHAQVSFRNEVMAVLSRGGCNQGTCHGNMNGKGGFKLSLRGEDAVKDFDTLTRGAAARRINVHEPQESLILQKATAQVPHEGGRRFPAESHEYQLLLGWIAGGANFDSAAAPRTIAVEPAEKFLLQPADEIKVSATVTFADGSTKDVSALAVFESTNPSIEVSRQGVVKSSMPGETTVVVRYLHLQTASQLAFVPARPNFTFNAPKPANYIDELIFDRLRKLRVNPSEVCSDSEFIRRAYLDLHGLLPTPQETKQFLADPRSDKRSRLIDWLLARPEFAEYWALRWADLLRNEEKRLDKTGVKVFQEWIRRSFADEKPLNEFARELIASRGSTYKEPPANYYRVLRDPHARSEAMAQVFLGIRMQCAKCHNHPFNQWTQNDYHQLAAFFSRIQYQLLDTTRRDKLDKHEFIGDQIVYLDDSSELKHPYSGDVMQPRFLGGPTPQLGFKDNRLVRLADWIADPDNPFFARAQANRIWSYLMGRGIVEPNDDFRQSNPPVNGPLLEALAKDLKQSNFNQKALIRAIMNSHAYQFSAKPNETNSDDETNFSRNVVRSLPAEALLDSIAQVTQTSLSFEGYPEAKRAAQVPSMPVIRRGESFQGSFRFLKIFGKPERMLSCDCERSDGTTLAQALQLITGDIINKAIADADNVIAKMLQAGKSNAEIIDELYLSALCRSPALSERSALVERVDRAMNRREALEDVLWGLLNSKEFLLRR